MRRGKICISVAERDAQAVARRVEPVVSLADVVEVRLDAMEQPQVSACCRLLSAPLLFTNRPHWEGGLWQGNESARLESLLAAVQQDAAYVDFELRAERSLRQELLAARASTATRVILSWHDFQNTPATGDLEDIFHRIRESGADIGKIVATAHHYADVIRLQQLLPLAQRHNFPLICFSMGEPGRISRLATVFLGGYMTYTCADDERATAPGQFTLLEMVELCRLMEGAKRD